MKPYLYSLIAVVAACGLASAQTTAYTTPVGYITSYIGPNASGSSAGSATFIGASLVQPTVYAGASNGVSSPSGASVIGFSGNVPTTLDSTYVLEITEGANEGWWSAVDSSTATSITITDVFPAGLPANAKVAVRKFDTIQSVFGANTPGLAPYSTSEPYDEIQFLDPLTQATGIIVYADGWFNLLTESDASNEIIYPGTSVKVTHRANTTLSVVSSGTVKTTKTQVDLYPNDNWLGQPNPTGGTLGSMEFGTQILTTDLLTIFNTDPGTGQGTTGYVASGGVMYNLLTEADASTEPVPEGSGYLITRSTGGQTTIAIPAQAVGP